MTNRMLKHPHILKLLHKSQPHQRTALIKAAKPTEIHAICDCIKNILHQRVPISSQKKGVLAKKKNVLRELAHNKTSTGRKRKLLVQHGNGFLSTILETVLNALGSI